MQTISKKVVEKLYPKTDDSITEHKRMAEEVRTFCILASKLKPPGVVRHCARQKLGPPMT